MSLVTKILAGLNILAAIGFLLALGNNLSKRVALEKNVGTLKSTLAGAQKQKEEARAEYWKTRSEYDRVNEDFKVRLDDLEKEKGRRQEQIRSYQERIAEHKKQLEREQQENKKIADQIKETEQRLAALQAELEEAVAGRNVAQGRLKDMQEKLAELRKLAENQNNEVQKLAEEVRRLERALGTTSTTGGER